MNGDNQIFPVRVYGVNGDDLGLATTMLEFLSLYETDYKLKKGEEMDMSYRIGVCMQLPFYTEDETAVVTKEFVFKYGLDQVLISITLPLNLLIQEGVSVFDNIMNGPHFSAKCG